MFKVKGLKSNGVFLHNFIPLVSAMGYTSFIKYTLSTNNKQTVKNAVLISVLETAIKEKVGKQRLELMSIVNI